MSDLATNLAGVEEQIRRAAAKAGRNRDEIELVAASKKQPPEKVRAAIEAGQLLFGESKVQEARAKIPELPSSARWHYIGRLQKNKVRQALPLFEMIHSIDSLALAEDIERIATEEGVRVRGLLQVNVAGESSKAGFSPDGLRENLEALLRLSRVDIVGLMTIPPLAPEPEQSRPFFIQLRGLRDECEKAAGISLPHLSMGMSNDFEIAIEEGATLVRVGTALFGER